MCKFFVYNVCGTAEVSVLCLRQAFWLAVVVCSWANTHVLQALAPCLLMYFNFNQFDFFFTIAYYVGIVHIFFCISRSPHVYF